MKPSSSAASIGSKTTTKFVYSKQDKIKYPSHEDSSKESSYKKKREQYNAIKSNREPRRLIEFKLHDDESIETPNLEDSKNVSKEIQQKTYTIGVGDNKTIGISRRLYHHKSEHKLDTIKAKYGNPSTAHSYKPKNPSISIEKSIGSAKELRSKTSRNTPLSGYKIIKSIKHEIGSADILRKPQSSLSIKTPTYKPSQVQINLKKD